MHRQGIFYSADTSGIPIHVGIIAVTGWVYQEMKYNKNQSSPYPLNYRRLA